MVTALPLDLVAEIPHIPPAPDLLTPEDAAWLRSFAALCEEDEACDPGTMDREIAASRMYGTDSERELVDIHAGRHPLQQPR